MLPNPAPTNSTRGSVNKKSARWLPANPFMPVISTRKTTLRRDLVQLRLYLILHLSPKTSDDSHILICKSLAKALQSRKQGMEYHFCPRCGHALELRPAEENHIRPICPSCGLIVYLNPPIAAGVVASRADGKILLVLRGENP